MAISSKFGTSAGNATVSGTLDVKDPIMPVAPPDGLQAIGPRVTFHFTGLWDKNTDYVYYDVAKDGSDNSYIAIKPKVPAGTALTDSEYWFKFDAPNQQFYDLEQTVETYKASIDKNSNDIADLNEIVIDHETLINNNTSEINKRILYFDSVASMKNATNLSVGDTVHTDSFYKGNNKGGAFYKIVSSAAADEKAVFACNNNLFAQFINTEAYVTPEMFGAYGDGVNEDSKYIQYAVDNFYCIKGANKYLVNNTVTISKSTESAPFYDIEFTGSLCKTQNSNTYMFIIDGNGTRFNAQMIKCSVGNGIKIGDKYTTWNFEINVNTIYAKIPYSLGSAKGVLDGNISGERVYYGATAFYIDLTQNFVGQIGFYNMRISYKPGYGYESSDIYNYYAFDINCVNSGCTGLTLYNISFEEAINGIHAYNMHTTNTGREFSLQTLYIFSARIAEFISDKTHKILNFEGTSRVYGEAFFDRCSIDSIDVSNYDVPIAIPFKVHGYTYQSDLGYPFLGFEIVNKNNIFGEPCEFLTGDITTKNYTPAKYINIRKDTTIEQYKYQPRETYLYALADCILTITNIKGSSETINLTKGNTYILRTIPVTKTETTIIVDSLTTTKGEFSYDPN